MEAPRPKVGVHRLCFRDQAPRIGSGWRNVKIERLGYKWVHLRCLFTDRPQRILRTRFNEIWEGTHACIARNADPVYPKRRAR